MKKYAKLITAILLVSLLALSLFACFDPSNDTEGTMTLVLLDGNEADAEVFVVDLSKIPSGDSAKGLMAVLDYLQEEGKLTYTESFGLLTQVGGLQQHDSTYLYIYTDVVDDVDVSQYAVQITYKDKSYTNSGVGASDMHIKSGCVVIITYIEW